MNENMRRHLKPEPIEIHAALDRAWSEDDSEGLRQVGAFVERLRFTQQKNYAETMKTLVGRGICSDENDFEALMMALDNSQH
jgi:hypothetical protein